MIVPDSSSSESDGEDYKAERSGDEAGESVGVASSTRNKHPENKRRGPEPPPYTSTQPLPVQDEEESTNIQLYVLVARCIAFPFSAQVKSTMSFTRHAKIDEEKLKEHQERFSSFLRGELTWITSDESFDKAIGWYHDAFLSCSRLATLVRSGGCTSNGLRKVFQSYVEKFLKQLPQMERVAHEHVMASWMAKYEAIARGSGDAETARRESFALMVERQHLEESTNPEHLYRVFQTILNIKPYEHQLLLKELQLDNADEQAAVIRRELRQRRQILATRNTKEIRNRLVVKEHVMASEYLTEQQTYITQLEASLNQMPVSKKNVTMIRNKRPPSHHDGDRDPGSVHKSDIMLSFTVVVTVMEARRLSLQPDRLVYSVMEMDGVSNKMATNQLPASHPNWATEAKFTSTCPLPNVHVKMYAESKSLLNLEGKLLGKLTLRPTPCDTEVDQWLATTPPSGHGSHSAADSPPELLVSCYMEKPDSIKISGSMHCRGTDIWKKWKKHYFILVQMTTYAFALCTYREKQTTPAEVMPLGGCTVDYCDNDSFQGENEPGYTTWQFHALTTGGSVVFCCPSRQQLDQWVYHLYRATGQTHRPQPPSNSKSISTLRPTKTTGTLLHHVGLDASFLTRDITSFNHEDEHFPKLLRLTLAHRLRDKATSMGWFTPGQQYVIDEYKERYCLRGFLMHVTLLRYLLENAKKGTYIDANLIYYSFTFCSAHVQGQKPDGHRSVFIKERKEFEEIRTEIQEHIFHQLDTLNQSFPFNLPDGGLKATLVLLTRVCTDLGRPSAPKDQVGEVCKHLRNAALSSYTALTNELEKQSLQIAEEQGQSTTNRLQFLATLTVECIELMQQNKSDYSDTFAEYEGVIEAHEEAFWSFFEVDLESTVKEIPMESWDIFQVFEQLNSYLMHHPSLNKGKFHEQLMVTFMPLVAHYLDVMGVKLEKDLSVSIAAETWRPEQHSSRSAEEVFVKLRALHRFVQRLAWPEPMFADHLVKRVQRLSADTLILLAVKTHRCFREKLAAQRPRSEALYTVPRPLWVMLSVVHAAIEQASTLCTEGSEERRQSRSTSLEYGMNVHSSLKKICEQMESSLTVLLNVILADVLSKLTRYDPGNFMSNMWNFLRSKSFDLETLSMSVEHNLVALEESVAESYINEMIMVWYRSMLSSIQVWLQEHTEQTLKAVQFETLSQVVELIRHRFTTHFSTEQQGRIPLLSAVEDRLRLEQSAAELAMDS